MNTKLTLTIEQSIIEKAKKYARKKERSLSDLVESYLKALTTEENITKAEDELSPALKSLKGSFKMSKNFDYKKELSDRLTEKYL
jgi:5'-deoxynucleotidase YfbR-like HD superfamily hydrolase